MTRRIILICLCTSALLVASTTSRANDTTISFDEDPVLQRVLSYSGSLTYHPDLRYRIEGVRALEQNREGAALSHFKHAARHADKPSQAMLAEMYFQGRGVPQDRATGYAWMDLAAERGWPVFVAKREHYWEQLSAEQRERALEVGIAIYAEYEDAAAQPRLERQLRRGRRESTGSRVGASTNTQVETPGVIGMGTRTHSFDRRFWEPEQYWAMHDAVWGISRVEVRPLISVD